MAAALDPDPGPHLAGLTITPPANSDADITLTVTATSTEANGGDTEQGLARST